jgi:AraC-like DNA-binding protein
MVALVGWAVILGGDLAWRIVQVAALALVGFGLWQVLGGRAGDLVEGRRRFRLVLAIGVGLSIVAFIALGAVSYSSPRIRDYGGVASAGIVLALGLASAMFRLGVRPSPPLEVDPAGPRRELTAATPIAIDPEERALLDRLRHLMESERIYREEGLGVGALAARLGLPEYRLRRLINQRLGHRNFSSFVNGYRLAETAAALADPAQAQVPVLTIALDAGFQSIGPFNRAFKAQTGMTPTDFRRERLERAAAAPLGAPIPKSASI